MNRTATREQQIYPTVLLKQMTPILRGATEDRGRRRELLSGGTTRSYPGLKGICPLSQLIFAVEGKGGQFRSEDYLLLPSCTGPCRQLGRSSDTNFLSRSRYWPCTSMSLWPAPCRRNTHFSPNPSQTVSGAVGAPLQQTLHTQTNTDLIGCFGLFGYSTNSNLHYAHKAGSGTTWEEGGWGTIKDKSIGL